MMIIHPLASSLPSVIAELGGDAWSTVNNDMIALAKELNITLAKDSDAGNNLVG